MLEQRRPRIAVVDAFSSGVHLARSLGRVGADVVHIRSAGRLDDYYEATFRPDLVSLDLGFASGDRQLRALRALGVDRVLPGTESGVRLAEDLAARLGVPTNTPRLAVARRDKYEMVRALRAAAVAAPRSATASSADEAARWSASEALELVVVKPLGSAGSDNVRVCVGAAEVHEAAVQVLGSVDLFGRPNRAVLVQEFLSGPEFYVNAVSTRPGITLSRSGGTRRWTGRPGRDSSTTKTPSVPATPSGTCSGPTASERSTRSGSVTVRRTSR